MKMLMPEGFFPGNSIDQTETSRFDTDSFLTVADEVTL